MTRQSQHDLPLSLAPSSNEQLMSTDGAQCLLIPSQHLNGVAMTINADLSKQTLNVKYGLLLILHNHLDLTQRDSVIVPRICHN